MLGDLLDELCRSKGMEMWRRHYAVVRNGPHLEGLRELLRRLGLPVWLELASGSSRRVYAGLDVFVRCFAGEYEGADEARYLVCDRESHVSLRVQRRPEDWYYSSNWESCGQGQPNFEYVIDDFIELAEAVVLQSATPEPVRAYRRVEVLSRHLGISTSAVVPYGNGKGGGKGPKGMN
jgi:hypothetical protein